VTLNVRMKLSNTDVAVTDPGKDLLPPKARRRVGFLIPHGNNMHVGPSHQACSRHGPSFLPPQAAIQTLGSAETRKKGFGRMGCCVQLIYVLLKTKRQKPTATNRKTLTWGRKEGTLNTQNPTPILLYLSTWALGAALCPAQGVCQKLQWNHETWLSN
jgi:hypothetical protein